MTHLWEDQTKLRVRLLSGIFLQRVTSERWKQLFLAAPRESRWNKIADNCGTTGSRFRSVVQRERIWMSQPSLGSPEALPWLIKPAPRFPATTILLKNHLSLAVRLGTGDYKQLRKRLTGDRSLTALWPSHHYGNHFLGPVVQWLDTQQSVLETAKEDSLHLGSWWGFWQRFKKIIIIIWLDASALFFWWTVTSTFNRMRNL